jgi:hypothetical protein
MQLDIEECDAKYSAPPQNKPVSGSCDTALCGECIHFMHFEDGDDVCTLVQGWFPVEAKDNSCSDFREK